VAADAVGLPAELERELERQPLEADDVDGGMARRDKRRLTAELPHRGDRCGPTLGGAIFAFEDERARTVSSTAAR
jgi:hypothetical protein